ncbi:MAG: rhomboid family intramembrane serine protease [Planctomycetaceae bacterium]|nr:rhomboid family intramembrane serine protease [Planctomycetaceae bacterium]
MLPLQDNIPSRTTPFVNYAVIACCAVVFLFQLGDQPGEPSMVERYGMIPHRVVEPQAVIEIDALDVEQTQYGPSEVIVTREAAPSAVPPFLTALTCIFLHGGWMHILGNMWFLFIFGDNVEDRFGHLGYAAFYLVSGIGASLVHLASEPGSNIPTIGASGAIAGVMGAYFLWYRNAQVKALIPLGAIAQIVVLPAWIFLGFWFGMQFLQGTMSILSTQAGGVAWWAHIGGFVVGLAIAFAADSLRLTQPANLLRDDSRAIQMRHRRRGRSFY